MDKPDIIASWIDEEKNIELTLGLRISDIQTTYYWIESDQIRLKEDEIIYPNSREIDINSGNNKLVTFPYDSLLMLSMREIGKNSFAPIGFNVITTPNSFNYATTKSQEFIHMLLNKDPRLNIKDGLRQDDFFTLIETHLASKLMDLNCGAKDFETLLDITKNVLINIVSTNIFQEKNELEEQYDSLFGEQAKKKLLMKYGANKIDFENAPKNMLLDPSFCQTCDVLAGNIKLKEYVPLSPTLDWNEIYNTHIMSNLNSVGFSQIFEESSENLRISF